MSPELVRRNAEAALDARLYVSGWGLYGALRLAVAHPNLFHVELHHEDGKPVAIALAQYRVTERRLVNAIGMQVFVKPAYRRRNIASALIRKVMHEVPRKQRSDFRASKGAIGSDVFWRSHGVKPWYCPNNLTPEQWQYSS